MAKTSVAEEIEAGAEIAGHEVMTQDDGAAPFVVTTVTDAPDPLTTGMTALRAADLDPLRIWSTKGPKGVGGTLSGVFLQATRKVVLMHQLDSGRFAIFTKANIADLSGDD